MREEFLSGMSWHCLRCLSFFLLARNDLQVELNRLDAGCFVVVPLEMCLNDVSSLDST
ncbi:hypothetical protein [Synechococcus sp. KORDI-100]|uniref:hypothetical protein n=1 Tax=Synechococcus sp. KORDI-100 TaxID=1280380 RepID=UPI0012E02112|nr:hypothetical protein [Synechococcus sp. KORDI-100]